MTASDRPGGSRDAYTPRVWPVCEANRPPLGVPGSATMGHHVHPRYKHVILSTPPLLNLPIVVVESANCSVCFFLGSGGR